MPGDLRGIHPAPAPSVLLIHPFQAPGSHLGLHKQFHLHALVGLPACHHCWVPGSLKHFKSPLPCCQIFPPPAPTPPHLDQLCEWINSPSQKPGHHPFLPLIGHIQSTPMGGGCSLLSIL